MKPEWRDRLRHMENALMRDMYHPLGEIALSGFVTEEELSLEEAAARTRSPLPTAASGADPGSIPGCSAR